MSVIISLQKAIDDDGLNKHDGSSQGEKTLAKP